MPRKMIRPRGEAVAPDEGGMYFTSPKENLKFIRSGCTMLDCVLGGGWPLGRIVNIVGDKSTGKTLLAMEAVANFFQAYPDGAVRYNEAESAFDADYARALGIPFTNVELEEGCDTVEDFYVDLEKFMGKSQGPKLYIIDSLDSLSSKAEQERKMTDASYGDGKAKKMSEFFRRMKREITKAECCLIVISQVRDNIGVTFGKKHTRSGGKALDFYASQILWLAFTGAKKRTVSKVTKPVGIGVKAKCEKNKVGLPLRSCEFEITFGYGIEDEAASLAFLKEVGKAPPTTGLSAFVTKEWYRIETTFLPTRQKYGEA